MRKIDVILLVLLFAGLADGLYLALVEANSVPLYCSASGQVNCSKVITSHYSSVFGMPIAYASLVWFAIALLLFFSATKHHRLLQARNAWLVLGIGAALYSAMSMYAISAICEYCASLDVILVAIAALALLAARAEQSEGEGHHNG